MHAHMHEIKGLVQGLMLVALWQSLPPVWELAVSKILVSGAPKPYYLPNETKVLLKAGRKPFKHTRWFAQRLLLRQGGEWRQ